METAFLKIVDEHQRIIHKISRMYRDTREDQEDLFQEIVFQLWKAFPAFRGDAKASTWLYRIALNTAIASFRKNQIGIDREARIPEVIQAEETTTRREQEERMYAAFRQLNDIEKALIALYLDDHSYAEIAALMGISESNVGVKINRIKTKLKTILNQ